MVFRVAALHLNVFFELTLGGVESVAERDIDVFVGLFVVVVATDHDMLLWNAQVDTDLVEITLVLVMMFCLDSDPATDDVIAELLQFCRLFANSGFDCIGMRYASKRNLQWYLHGSFSN